jgi:hypothetical protein
MIMKSTPECKNEKLSQKQDEEERGKGRMKKWPRKY